MGEALTLILIVEFVALVIAVFLMNDKLKILQYRLEQQIEQNEKIIKLLSKKEE
ncbi:hypothetical protein [Bacillus solitudinis]|uniref:hypothetical protein n=1 Tax=Bacillus solitudinis TaxID=2014074 RepID=UPI0012FE3A71|nr:hypothetical protein [Bacillus solitudinis]